MHSKAKLLVAVTLALSVVPSAFAGAPSDWWNELKNTNWEDGRLRIEGQGWGGVRSGGRSRSGDIGVSAIVEKEFMLGHKLTVSPRAIPLFYVDEYHRDGHDILGVGVGVTLRHYWSEPQDGFYFEFSESLIAHSEKFRGNSGSVNFMSELGIGYEFDSDWHVIAKWRHLSNAGIADKNSGINFVGIGVGYSF